MTQQQRPAGRRPAAGGAAPAAGRPARAQAQNSAPANDALFYEARLLPPSIQTFKGTVKTIGENVVQMYVHQRGGQLRLQDFPAKSVLAIIRGAEPNSDVLLLESASGQTLSKLVLTGYEGDYTTFQDAKGQQVLVRSDRALVQSDKQQPDAWGINTGSRSNAPAAGGGRGRRAG